VIETCRESRPFSSASRPQGRKALIPFVTAGFPAPELTLPLMNALVEGGADIIELGVPFSDPMADGPTIQRASERALAQGMSLRKVLETVRAFRATNADTPVVLMGYANPIEAMGQERFVAAAREAGVDGVLVVDYPPEECVSFAATAQGRRSRPDLPARADLGEQRFADVARAGSGYIYYVSLKGVTGSAKLDVDEVARRIPEIRAAVGMPVGVGFGIRDADSAQRIGAVADAVVIGSRIIEEIENNPGEEVARVRDFMRDPCRARCAGGGQGSKTGMSWFEKLIPPRIKRGDSSRSKSIPGRAVEQVRGLRVGAVPLRPREQPQRVPEVRPPPSPARASPPRPAARQRGPCRDRCRGAADRCAQVQGLAQVSRAPVRRRGRHRRGRRDGGDARRDQEPAGGGRLLRVRFSRRLDGLGGRRALRARRACGLRAAPALHLHHRLGRRAHAGRPAFADADGQDHRGDHPLWPSAGCPSSPC
jgi:tryptophan synthase alpha chain